MAANLKRDDKREEKRPPAKERERISLDLKWLLAAVGLSLIVFSSVVIGVKVSVDHFTNQTHTVNVPVLELPPKPGPTFKVLDDQVVNLNGGRFLRFTVAMQFAANDKLFPDGGGGGEGKKVNPIEKYDALIRDAIVTVASRHTAMELLDPAGKDRLKEEIKAKLNAAFKNLAAARDEADLAAHPAPQVFKVYFPSFVIS